MSANDLQDNLQKNKNSILNEGNLLGSLPFVHDQFLLFGDSITQSDGDPTLGFSCYQALQHDYSRRIDFVKRGFSGYNTVNALSILPRIIPNPEQGRVRLISIFFGPNDISLPDTTGQHVPLQVFEENLRRLVEHPKIQAHENIRVLLITPPPIDEWGFDHWDEPGRSARTAVTAQQYAVGVKNAGEEMGVAVVDLWGACMREATVGWNASLRNECSVELLMPGDKRAERSDVLARLLYDGLHLSGDGYKILYQEIKKTIIQAYPELRPSKIPVALEPFFPEWFEDNAPW
ncbi:SGNH hydrolase [Macroventuria anomochaeta]|uniref:SGNH hydrolase n=1 Tax=Macroventuria anomochaeta TaxID=301207 RepID=A0ACB6RQ26_9PLEO|nr:SGNH hydrolase [Macroventuria anomochaeta]KAF2623019.1 SGNH hydrolase [Macroventuria anomochaeta]